MDQGFSSPKVKMILAAALVAAAGFMAFSPCLTADFVFWDDDLSIYGNELISHLDAEHFRRFFSFQPATLSKYAPLYWLSLAMNRALFGDGPFSFHLVNLVFHAAGGVLLFLILHALLLHAFPGERERVPAAALFGALVWAVHPLRVNAVALAANRSYCQAALFLLASFFLYLSASLKRPDRGSLFARPGYWGSLLFLSVSLFSFPMGLGFPAACLALDVWLFRTWRLPGRVLAEKIPLAAVTALALAANLAVRSDFPGPLTAGLPLDSPLFQAARAFYMWGFPLGKTLLPTGLTPLPTLFLNPAPPLWPFVLALLAVGGISALLFLMRRRFPGLFLCWLTHLALLVPVLLESFPSERYTGLPAAALSPAAGAGLLLLMSRASGHPASRRILQVSAWLAVLLLLILSMGHTAIWKNSVSLFEHILSREEDRPYHASVHTRLGMTLINQGDLAKALHHFDQALDIEPGRPDPLFARGIARVFGGDYNAAEEDLEAALLLAEKSPRLSSLLPGGYTHAGDAYFSRERFADALRWYGKALDSGPPDAPALVRMGICQANLGSLPEALRLFQEAVEKEPANLLALYNLGRAWKVMGKPARARVYLERTLEQDPAFAPARAALAALPPLPGRGAGNRDAERAPREIPSP